ncbi:hypothetical protein F4820DRAFT_155848 [Hypoxylon rubiginosum]|uniref:Uncharacterized protein n=1 Tax=Hypoxylon rubiginosum TaxID=110542 RepID=A0ACB9YJX3_9PEZI|nr:hypothetical protein F4820DRAFT_155848 [Hypoxylon rubiginosum]
MVHTQSFSYKQTSGVIILALQLFAFSLVRDLPGTVVFALSLINTGLTKLLRALWMRKIQKS